MKCEKCGLDRKDSNHIAPGQGVLVLNAEGVVIERLRKHWGLCCDGVLIGPSDYERYHESYMPQITRTVQRKMEHVELLWGINAPGETQEYHLTWNGIECPSPDGVDRDCGNCINYDGRDDCGAEAHSPVWEAVDPTYTFKTWK